jgi:hypothetical protein
MDTVSNDPANRNANGTLGLGNKIGHRFPKGHGSYRKNVDPATAYARLKRNYIRDLKKEYGPDLTFKQNAHIRSIGGIMARLEIEGKDIDHASYSEWHRELRHHMDALGEG